MSCRAASALDRSSFSVASISAAWATPTSAVALVRLARAWSSSAWNSETSSLASTSPLRTIELKSTGIALIRPDTWDPTSIVVTASSVPVQATLWTTSPEATSAVASCTGSALA